MTIGGIPVALAWLCWALAVAANGYAIFHVTRDRTAGFVIGRAIVAVVGAMILITIVGIGIRSLGIRPPRQVGNMLLSAFFSIVVIAVANVGNAMFRLAGDQVAAFHAKNNAANLDRFPVTIVTRHRPLIERASAVIWLMGAALMLYGVWFDMQL